MARQDEISPNITQLYGEPLPTKRRALYVSQAQAAQITFQFLDLSGNPVDLTEYVSEGSQDLPSVECRIREVITTRVASIYAVSCDIEDAENGIVVFDIPADVATNPGVYTAELAALSSAELNLMRRVPRRRHRRLRASRFGMPLGSDPNETIVFSNKCFIWVDRGLFGNPDFPNAGPPTLDEIRLYVRDNAPEENKLLDDFEFDLAEICHAAELGVRLWNESQPPIDIFYSTCSYAVRDKWLQYIAGHMFCTAAHRFRRNHLPYQAGGIAIDDQNKFQQYDEMGMALIADYREWIKMKKTQINCMLAMTSHGSLYGVTAYTMLNTGQ